MRRIVFFIGLALLMVSCGEYQKVLNKGTNADKYKMAVDLYEQGEYKKAIVLFEKVIGPYANKPQLERIQYMISDSYFQTENYAMSAYYFEKFTNNYPESTKSQEAAYYSAKSYFLAAPKYSRDQEDTYKAINAYQSFIDRYPNSELIEEANRDFELLNRKLEEKDFEIAKQYYHTEYYGAAVAAMDTFNEEHLASEFKEEAMYIRFKASYELGMRSILDKKEERITDAISYHKKFVRAFPQSERLEEMDQMVEKLQKEMSVTKEQLTTISQIN